MDTVTIRKLDVSSGIRQTIQFARVRGLPDRLVAERVNRVLRAGAEDTLDGLSRDLIHGRDHPEDAPDVSPATSMLSSRAVIGLANAKVVAVQYRFSANGAEFGRFAETSDQLVVDLTSGRELTPRDLLAPRVATAEGASELTRVLAAAGPGGRLCDLTPPDVRTAFRPEELIGKDGVVGVFPTADGVDFSLGLWKLGYPMACNQQVIKVGYPRLRGFLGPYLS